MNPAYLLSNANMVTRLEAFCARLPKRHYLALRVAWHGDEGGRTRHELYGLLMAWAVERALSEKWKTGHLDRLVNLAIDELAHPFPGDASLVRSHLAGVSESSWSKVWRRRYEGLYGEVLDWANTGFSHVWRMQDMDPDKVPNDYRPPALQKGIK